MWDDYSKSPENALEWQNQYQRFMFDLEDASGDGSIDIDEFTSVCSCYGLKPQECREAFQKMSGVSITFTSYSNWTKLNHFTGPERGKLRTIQKLVEAILCIRKPVRSWQLHLWQDQLLSQLTIILLRYIVPHIYIYSIKTWGMSKKYSDYKIIGPRQKVYKAHCNISFLLCYIFVQKPIIVTLMLCIYSCLDFPNNLIIIILKPNCTYRTTSVIFV